MDTLISTSNAIELPEATAPARDHAVPTDHEAADRIVRAIDELQATIDVALLAGLMVEPSFVRIENRLAPVRDEDRFLRLQGPCVPHAHLIVYRRINSSVCDVTSFHRLT